MWSASDDCGLLSVAATSVVPSTADSASSPARTPSASFGLTGSPLATNSFRAHTMTASSASWMAQDTQNIAGIWPSRNAWLPENTRSSSEPPIGPVIRNTTTNTHQAGRFLRRSAVDSISSIAPSASDGWPIRNHAHRYTSTERLFSQFTTPADRALTKQNTPISRQYQVSHRGTLVRMCPSQLTLLTVIMCPAPARLRSYYAVLLSSVLLPFEAV